MIIDIANYCTPDNASQGVIKAINDAKNGDVISFPKGEYHFFKEYSQHKVYHMTNTDSFVIPDKHFAVLIEDKDNITIEGNDSVFVIHGDMCTFAAIRCNGINVKNLTIRYYCPTNVEMTVKEIKGNKIIYSFPETMGHEVNGRDITFYEESPNTHERYYERVNNPRTYCNVIHRGDDVFRTQISPLRFRTSVKNLNDTDMCISYLIKPRLKVGDVMTMSQSLLRDTCGLFFWECKDLYFENMTVNYMHGFGWLCQMCENITYEKVQFKPADGFVVSSFADHIHICGCKGKVKINDCFFTHPHDDGINIHGAFLRTKKVIDDKTVEFKFVHKQQGGYKAFFPGDKVKFYRRENLKEIDGVYTVESTEDNINNKTVIIKFKEKLPELTELMTVIENITYNPEVTITNCFFKSIPTRGILCTTDRKAEIYNNRFENLRMPDIFVSCDCRDWYESGPCKNMEIHDNVFSQKNPVLFKPISLGKPVDNVHENIRVFNNTIKESTK